MHPAAADGPHVGGRPAAAGRFVVVGHLVVDGGVGRDDVVLDGNVGTDGGAGRAGTAAQWNTQLGNSHPTDVLAIVHGLKVPATASGWDDAPRGSTRRVPNLRGMSLRDALYVLENRGFVVSYTGRGKVSSQSLAAGTLPRQRRIRLELR